MTFPKRAIENHFPVACVSRLAEQESWRKELHQPLSYVHKWWARRLGSVFRAIAIGCCAAAHEDIMALMQRPVAFPDMTVFDPFMGSGTTVYEAMKLGCRVIGRDINPVAYTMVHAILQDYSLAEVQAEFRRLEQTAGRQIRALYSCTDAEGNVLDVLYYFWVKVVECPGCGHCIDLFKSRIFAKHAYPNKHPRAKSLCPRCGAVNDILHNATEARCEQCAAAYDPQAGVVHNARVNCPQCGHGFALLDILRKSQTPLEHRLYAKMVLQKNAEKAFLPANQEDLAGFCRAQEMLADLRDHIPDTPIQPGYNTNQILNYNYRYWRQMFNARQLAALGLLASEIARIENVRLRELFACLFSGILEFNNMFASFKGIGTGAVRHLYSHHILKPELTPLEANPWGTDKSSGSFSTLFESRIRRALKYKAANLHRASAPPASAGTVDSFQAFRQCDGEKPYISVGDSSRTDIAESSVDVVITDPPFFDNVHYSELADFFHVWLRRIMGSEGVFAPETTRSPREVQNTSAEEFAERLAGVFTECHRVLKEDGLLVFTYHHARADGWTSLHQAIRKAGFFVHKAYPVKSEMAVAVPMQQAKEPINYDLILVCQKEEIAPSPEPGALCIEDCLEATRETVQALRAVSLDVTPADVRLMLTGCLLAGLRSLQAELSVELETFERYQKALCDRAEEILHSPVGIQLQLSGI